MLPDGGLDQRMQDEKLPGALATFAEAAARDPDFLAAEIDRGSWVPVTRGTWRHGEVVLNVAVALKAWARERGGFMVAVADPGTRLGHEPDVLRGPDVGVVREARRPSGGGQRGWLEGAPDLAVEVASEGQSPSLLTARALEYLGAGGGAVWVVDPAAELVLAFAPGNTVAVFRVGDVITGGNGLPGFSCPVADFFAR